MVDAFPPAFPVVVAAFAPSSPSDDDLLDSVEAAAILGVTLNHMRQMVFKKQLTPVGKKGRRSVFTRADVNALADSRRKEPVDADSANDQDGQD